MREDSVVVVGYNLTALGIARCLARSGFRVVTIGHVGNARKFPLYRSRIPAKKIVVPPEEDLTQALIDVRGEFSAAPALMLSEDSHAVGALERGDEVAQAYRILLPPQTLGNALLDKEKFARLAAEMDLKVPRSLEVGSRAELDDAIAELSCPFVLKPYLRHSRKIGNTKELEGYLDTLGPENWRSMVAQQWIPGDDRSLFCCFAYFDEGSKPLGSVTAQKIRQWRPASGTTSLCRTVRNDDVKEETLKILSSLGLVGYGSIEYKLHADEGAYYIMEPTIIRFNQQVALFGAAGVNLPLIAAEYLVRGRTEPSSQRDGVWWIHEFNDILSRRDRRQDVKVSYWRSLLRADVRVLFSRSDPAPFFAAVGSAAATRLGRSGSAGAATEPEASFARRYDA